MRQHKWKIVALFACLVATLGLMSFASAIGPNPAPSIEALTRSCTTDSLGYCTVSHSLGVVPDAVDLTPKVATGVTPYYTLSGVSTGLTTTTVKVRAMTSSTASLNNKAITFWMVVYGVVTPPTTTTTPPPPPPGGFPNNSNTGVPVGTVLTTVTGDLTVTTPQTINAKHVTGNLWVCVDNVVITNSQIDGVVGNYTCGDPWKSFTITDSLVGPSSGCISANTAVSGSAYTATRVHTRNVSDGFGVSASGTNPPVTVQDSLVELCGAPADHSDGIQLYLSGNTVVHFVHNTVDQLPCSKAASFPSAWPCTSDAAQTAPIFVSDSSQSIDARDNLLIGGSSTIRVGTSANPVTSATVTGNRVVNNAWQFGPVDSTPCAAITWSDNTLVNADANYQITATIGSLTCAP